MNLQLLPKVELHLHLDCSLSYNVVQRIQPSIRLEQYQREFNAGEKCVNLADFLAKAVRGFQLMQTEEHIEWVVEDLFAQLAADQVIYAEIRFAPYLHLEGGLTLTQVVAAADRATRRCMQQTGIEARLILCTLRHYSEAQSMETARLVKQFAGTTVAGLDIAGDEAGYPLDAHLAAFDWAHTQGLHITAHAGEACGPESVWDTLEKLKPTRIGHGARSIEDESLVRHLRQHQVHLEICPTCNVLIDMYDNYDGHPIDKLYRSGVSVNVNTDNRTITNIGLTQEYERLQQHFGWTLADFYNTNVKALQAAFIDASTREQLIQRLTNGYQQQS